MPAKYGAEWIEGDPVAEDIGAHANASSIENATDDVDYFAAYAILH